MNHMVCMHHGFLHKSGAHALWLLAQDGCACTMASCTSQVRMHHDFLSNACYSIKGGPYQAQNVHLSAEEFGPLELEFSAENFSLLLF